MLRHAKLAMSALVAGLVLLVATSVAGAATIAVGPNAVRAAWSPMTFTVNGATIRCPVTLEGSFHSLTFSPVAGAPIGYISRASAASASCTGGRATLLAETLPWRVQYESSVGTLPEITGIRLKVLGVALRGEASELNCLYKSTEASPLRATLEVRANTVEVTGLRLDESASIPLVTREFFCSIGGNGRAAGTARVTEAGTTTQADLAVVNDDAPLSFNPGSPIVLAVDSIWRDVEVTATAPRTLETLTVVGARSSLFGVSNGCDGRNVGVPYSPVLCRMTVSFYGARKAYAFVRVPTLGLARFIRLSVGGE